jgi:hypothetical protein
MEVSMLEFMKEFWLFLRERKKFWLLPVAVVLFLVGSLLFLGQTSVVAPFIYAFF